MANEKPFPTKNKLLINDCWNSIGTWSGATEKCATLQQIIHCRNCPVYARAGRRLLDRTLPDEYIKEWTKNIAAEKTPDEKKSGSVFIFRAGKEWMAIGSKFIEEVLKMGPIHSVPHIKNKIFRGIVNIQGKLELCFSIGNVLGLEPHKVKSADIQSFIAQDRLVCAQNDGRKFVFPVSEVLGIFRYSQQMQKPLPVTVSRAKAAFTKSIVCIEGLDVGLLDENILFETLLESIA